MSAAFELSPSAIEQLRLCDATRPAGYPCAAGSCRFRVTREGRLCSVHNAQAQEQPSPEQVATLERWGWHRAGDGSWIDSQRKYTQHWRLALARIARDEARGDCA